MSWGYDTQWSGTAEGKTAEDLKLAFAGLQKGDQLWWTDSRLSWSSGIFQSDKILNQSSAFPVTLNQSSSLLKRIVWSMVSNALERSSKVNAVTC